MRRSVNYKPYEGREITQESRTIPDMSYTIKELLQKFTRGQSLDVLRRGTYDDVQDPDEYDRTQDPDFDLVDATELATELQINASERGKKGGVLEAGKGVPDITPPVIEPAKEGMNEVKD